MISLLHLACPFPPPSPCCLDRSSTFLSPTPSTATWRNSLLMSSTCFRRNLPLPHPNRAMSLLGTGWTPLHISCCLTLGPSHLIPAPFSCHKLSKHQQCHQNPDCQRPMDYLLGIQSLGPTFMLLLPQHPLLHLLRSWSPRALLPHVCLFYLWGGCTGSCGTSLFGNPL